MHSSQIFITQQW